jgi:4-carboxymuconolactone decarboxylase
MTVTESEGAQRRRRAQGGKADGLNAALAQLDPQMAEWSDSFVFGAVWGRPGLSHDERMMVAITALAATEHPAQLRNYLHGALEAGIPSSKIHEALVMMTVYAGFPTALSALVVWKEVVASARRRGIKVDIPEVGERGNQ